MLCGNPLAICFLIFKVFSVRFGVCRALYIVQFYISTRIRVLHCPKDIIYA